MIKSKGYKNIMNSHYMQQLPNTGANHNANAVGLGVLGALMALAVKRRRKDR